MKLPKKLQIGPLRYRVLHNKRTDILLNNADHLGETWVSKSEIRLSTALTGDALAETLIHEICHAINDVSGVMDWLGGEQEERLVRSISPYWLMVLRDNPKLVEAITR